MKRVALIIVLVFGTLLANAQTNNSELNHRLSAYLQICKDMDMDKMMDFIYPRIFELAPRELLVKEMKKMADSEEMKLSLDSLQLSKVDDITTAGNTHFTRFQYYVIMKIQIADIDTTQNQQASYLKSFELVFGKGHVTFNATDQSFRVNTTKYCLAIKDSFSKNQWTFVNQEQNLLLKNLLPEAVIKKYKI